MLIWLTGNDAYKCDRVVAEHRSKLDPNWQAFNFHRYGVEELEQVVSEANTMPFGSTTKVLVVQGDLKSDHEAYIKQLVDVPDYCVVILRVVLDARTKVGKLVKSKAKVLDYNLPSIWKAGALSRYIQQEATDLELRLSNPVADYLAEAIGEDAYRIHSELEKLSLSRHLLRGGSNPHLSWVQELVPNLNQNAIALANAIRYHNHTEVLSLTSELLARGEHPLKINAALLTMFRRWLTVKTARVVSDEVLAQRLNLGNPKRLYYLRQEVAPLDVEWLRRGAIALFELECKLKRSLDEEGFTLALLALT
ncbi:DNA polymerase III subunit delta [Allocoleopsis sp.]|uniref:DNA polymerase III subunit delta n=1 Tax=Allocoleopsis sp. TaxID=3088169 RepID=UPI002FD3B05E